MINFSKSLNNDSLILFEKNNFKYKIKSNSIEYINFPLKIENPILPLSNLILENKIEFLNNISFPFLININNNSLIQKINYEPKKCLNCNSFLLNEFEKCPFCQDSYEIKSSFFYKNDFKKNPIFLFIIIGNNISLNFLKDFKFPFYLCFYDNNFNFLYQKNNNFQLMTLIDDFNPNFYLINNLLKIPLINFNNKLNNINLNELIIKLNNFNFNFNNLILLINITHQCLKTFNYSYSISIFFNQIIKCDCNNIINNSGGLYLPYYNEIDLINLNHIISTNIQCILFKDFQIQNSLINQNYGIIHKINKMIYFNKPLTFQIQIQTFNKLYFFSFTLKTCKGLKSFLFESNLYNFLISINENDYLNIIKNYNENKENLIIPNNLKTFLFYPLINLNKNISLIYSYKHFIIQIYPTLKIIDFSSEMLFSSDIILLILFNNIIYLFIGGNISRNLWDELIGIQPINISNSFEIFENKNSKLWEIINEIKFKFYNNNKIPIIIIPSESGKRIDLFYSFEFDIINFENLIYKKFNKLINLIKY